jgi:hypothetical protein
MGQEATILVERRCAPSRRTDSREDSMGQEGDYWPVRSHPQEAGEDW